MLFRSQLFIEAQVQYYKENKTSKSGLWLVAEDFNGDERRRYGVAMAEATHRVCLVVSQEMERVQYTLAATDIDVRPIAKILQESFEGKGGGKAPLCQGTLVGPLEVIGEHFQEIVAPF